MAQVVSAVRLSLEDELAKIESNIDPPLTEKGIEQARKTGQYLKNLLNKCGFE